MQLWIQGHIADRLTLDETLTFFFSNHCELVLWTPFSLTSPPIGGLGIEHDNIDPVNVINEQRPLFTMLGWRTDIVDYNDDGDLHIEFGDGSAIDVPSDPEQPSWELFSKRHGYATCEKTGQVRVIEHKHAHT